MKQIPKQKPRFSNYINIYFLFISTLLLSSILCGAIYYCFYRNGFSFKFKKNETKNGRNRGNSVPQEEEVQRKSSLIKNLVPTSRLKPYYSDSISKDTLSPVSSTDFHKILSKSSLSDKKSINTRKMDENTPRKDNNSQMDISHLSNFESSQIINEIGTDDPIQLINSSLQNSSYEVDTPKLESSNTHYDEKSLNCN